MNPIRSFVRCSRLAPVALAWLLFPCPGNGREVSGTNAVPVPDTGGTVSVESLVAEALAGNPERRFYEAEISAATAGRLLAGQLANPELTAGVGQKTVRDAGLNGDGVAWSVSLVQPFEWPGRIRLRQAIANHDFELARLGYERFRAALASRVRSRAYGLFVAQEKSMAAGEVADRFKALREVLLQRDPAGLTPLLETRVIEATELNAQRKAGAARLATQSALFELNQLRGVPPGTPLSVAPVRLEFQPAGDTATLLAMARTNNFELRVRAAELAQQGYRVNLARNERFPSIGIGPSVSEEDAGGVRERVVGFVVSLPLPLWNQNRSGIETAAARRAQAEVVLDVAEREVQRRVIEAAATYETKRQEIEAWRPDSVQHFREAAMVADRHYRLGAVPISVYVELQKQYLDAVEGLLETKREALESAGELEQLTGIPMPFVRTQTTEGKP